MIKRCLDIAVSLLILVVTSPVWLVAALLIHRHDRGTVFFRQNRVGLHGKIFRIYKFRSMVLNADKVGGFSTSDGDLRITPVGRFLRRYSIDELPQLINVLVGDMSMIGPRPDVPAQRALYSNAEFEKRHSVRPGITGLAQATVRSSATPEERTRLDLEYVDRMSLGYDLKIIMQTVRQVVTKGGN